MMSENKYTVLLPYVKVDDPHLCTDSHALLVIRRLLFPGLLNFDGKTSRSVLAESWQQEDSGRTWRFNLKKGQYFENRRELTAEDAVYSLKRAASPDAAGQLFTVTFNEYIGRAKITAASRYSVLLQNPQPIADLEELLPDLSIIPAGWQNYSDGTGPGMYRLSSHDSSSVLLELKQDYYSKTHLPRTLLFKAEPDPEKRTALVCSGQAQLALDPLFKTVAELKESPDTEVIGWDTSLCVVFFIDCSAPFLKDFRVRQALNMAVDKEKLIRQIAFSQAKPLNGPLSDRHFACDPKLKPYRFDPEAAVELLRQAGVPEGFRLEVHAPMSIPEEGPALAEFLSESLRKIGITPILRLHSDRTGYAKQIAGKELHGVFCFDSSPLSSYKVLHEKIDSRFAGTWWQGYHNEKVNELISSAAASCSAEIRQGLYRKAYGMLHEDAPWIFLYQPRRFWAAHKSSVLKKQHFDDLGFFKI